MVSSVAIVTIADRARAADAADVARAEALFEEAQVLTANGQIAEACVKFAASQRLDPGLGTLLRLADCFEKSGRLASAFRTFREAAAIARERGDSRVDVAVSRAALLEGRLPRIVLEVSDATEVKLDGERIARESFGIALPVDAGVHVVRITVTGGSAHEIVVTVPAEGPPVRVAWPTTRVNDAPRPTVPPPRATSSERERSSLRRPVGIAVAGIGLPLVGYAIVRAIGARRTYDETEERCVGGCDDDAFERRADARAQANVATWVGLSGVALIGVGVTLFAWPSGKGPQLVAAPNGISLRGVF
jgi:hypothetical protein